MNKFVLAAACTLVAVPAFAQFPVPGVVPVPSMQVPNPGMIMAARIATRANVIARVQRAFAMLDANHDNVVERDELAGAQGRWSGARGDRPMRDRSARFGVIDSNHDGVITRDEFARAPRKGAWAMRRDRDGRPDGMHGEGMRGAGMARLWTMADANRDGRVTLAEATATALQHFDRIDANHDGQVTPDERAAGRAQWRQMRGR